LTLRHRDEGGAESAIHPHRCRREAPGDEIFAPPLAKSDARQWIGPAVGIENAEPDQSVPILARQQHLDRIRLRIVEHRDRRDDSYRLAQTGERERRALGTNLEIRESLPQQRRPFAVPLDKHGIHRADVAADRARPRAQFDNSWTRLRRGSHSRAISARRRHEAVSRRPPRCRADLVTEGARCGSHRSDMQWVAQEFPNEAQPIAQP